MAGRAVFLPPGMRSSYGPTARYQGGSYRTRRQELGSLPTTGFSRKTFENLENFIADNQASKEKVAEGIELLVRSMVLVIKGLAQQRSGGPIAPRHRSNPALAGRLPVQRITGAYFADWQQRRIGYAHWAVYNDTKEATLIEDGLYQRVRRPVLKMSLIGMLGLLQTTRTGDRFMDHVLKPRRNSHGQFVPFGGRLMGTQTLGGMAGPQGKLPG